MDIQDHEVTAAFPDVAHDTDTDSHVVSITGESAEAEAALEALRAAISSGVDHVDDYHHEHGQVDGQVQGPVTVAEVEGHAGEEVEMDVVDAQMPSAPDGVFRELGRLLEESKSALLGLDTKGLSAATAKVVRDLQESTTRQVALLAQLTSTIDGEHCLSSFVLFLALL